MSSGKKLLSQLKHLLTVNASDKYIEVKDLEDQLRNMFADDTFLQFADSAPNIIGAYNFREGGYIFFNKQMEYELGIPVNQLLGKENTETAMGLIHPQHGELWFFNVMPKMMEYWTQAGSREETMKISYSICVQVLNNHKEKQWFYMETDLLAAEENGTPLISVFYMTNVDEVKKDDLIYFSVRKKRRKWIYYTIQHILS